MVAYESGASSSELARQYGISHTTVTAFLETQGIEIRQRGLSEADVTVAAELYARGRSLAAIGKELGQNPSSVRDALVRIGVEMRRPHKLTSEEIDECVRLYDEGWSTVRLGKKFNVGDRTVAKALRARGVHLRHAGPQ